MTDHDTPLNSPEHNPDSDENVERLLGRSYRPDAPDPAFVKGVEAALLAASREMRAVDPEPAHPSTPRLLPRLGACAAAAAVIVAVFLLGSAVDGVRPVQPMTADQVAEAIDSVPASQGAFGVMIPRPLGDSPETVGAEVGETIETGASERRRVILPDGSVLYVNANTTAQVESGRRVRIDRGEVYVEVERDEERPFRVITPTRELTALGTRFAVDVAEGGATAMLVTHGRVEASGLDRVVRTGERLIERGGVPSIEAAERTSHLLDWTRDLAAAAASPLVPASDFEGGALIALDPWGQEARLTLRKYHVDVHIADGFARTTIDQTYFNHATWRMEGTFYFPLPADASLSRLAMYVAGRRMEGGMTERDRARDVYEQIVHRKKDPALLEWIDGSTFKMRVFPLEPREEKRILLSYVQRLPALFGKTTYRFPAGHDLGLVGDWSFRARVAGGAEDWASDSHALSGTHTGGDLVLSAEARGVLLDDDVVVRLDLGSAPEAGSTAFRTFEQDGKRYLMARHRPDLPSAAAPASRDWVFLFETSGARDPVVARAQVELIREMLALAEDGDRFAVITAATRARPLADALLPVSPENVRAALHFIEHAHLLGAFDLGKALAATRPFVAASERAVIVHVGSGVATLGERDPGALAKLVPEGAAYVGVAVGRQWSRGFMKEAARRTGGMYTQVDPTEALAWRAFELKATLDTPRILGARVVDEAEKARFLAFEDTAAHGEEIAAVAILDKGAKLPESITFSGTLEGRSWTRTVSVSDVVDGAGYLPRQWAKLEIDRLLADDAVGHRPAIVSLSKAMYVMSPYTSLLVLEDEAMYERFKVDRGRSDHWALYPAPDEIPVVREPYEGPARAVPGETKDPRELLGTIVVRVPPILVQHQSAGYSLRQRYAGSSVTVRDLLQAAQQSRHYQWSNRLVQLDDVTNGIERIALRAAGFTGDSAEAIDDPPMSRMFEGLERMRERSGRSWGRWSDDLDLRGALGGGWRQSPASRPVSGLQSTIFGYRLDVDGDSESFGQIDETFVDYHRLSWERKLLQDDLLGSQVELTSHRFSGPDRSLRLLFSTRDEPVALDAISIDFGLVDGYFTGRLSSSSELQSLGYLGAISTRSTNAKRPAGKASLHRDLFANRLIQRMNQGALYQTLQYQRPWINKDVRVFHDLLALAPGMNTSMADVAAVIDSEGGRVVEHGEVDEGAARLIAKARADGWRSLGFGHEREEREFEIVFDGLGRFRYERILPIGLREVVVCDGETLQHLYPEIGVGAVRKMSRHYRSLLTSVAPWLVGPVEELSRGAHVRLVGENVVEIVPLAGGKIRVRLEFGDDGRLSARRVVKDGEVVGEADYSFGDDSFAQRVNTPVEQSSMACEMSVAKAPRLVGDDAGLVVLPLPYRTYEYVVAANDLGAAANRNAAGWSEHVALSILGADFARNHGRALDLIDRRFLERDDRRPGFFTILRSGGYQWNATQTIRHGARRISLDPRIGNESSQLAHYIAGASDRDVRRDLVLPEDLREGFLGQFAGLASHVARWSTGRAQQIGRQEARDALLAFADELDPPALRFAALTLLWNHTGIDSTVAARVVGILEPLSDETRASYAVRYDLATALSMTGDHDQLERAMLMFMALHEEGLDSGVLPRVDGQFANALRRTETSQKQWRAHWLAAAAAMIESGSRRAVPYAAIQLHWMGDQALGDDLLDRALRDCPHDERAETSLALVEVVWQLGRHRRAEQIVEDLLADDEFAKSVGIWQLGAFVADQQGAVARGVLRQERALDLAFADLPDVVDLSVVRRQYGTLLSRFQQLATAVEALGGDVPDSVVGRVVRVADRWRALDDDPTQACNHAAQILRTLGRDDLAWDYLTTPLAARANESAPWVSLAQQLTAQGATDLADRCYATAFEIEPTNAQILWDRAEALRAAGRLAEARRAWATLAAGEWQPRFQWVQQKAKERIR